MNIFISTVATDLSAAVVTSASDFTAADDIGELVLGDSETMVVKFLSAASTYEAWSGDGSYTATIYLGKVTANGLSAYAVASLSTLVANGFSGTLALTTSELVNAVCLAMGYNPSLTGGWLQMQVVVTDPSGLRQTYAEFPIFVRGRVGAVGTSSPNPATSYLTAAEIAAALALKQNLLLPPAAMAALVIDATPGTVNTKSVSADTTFTQSGMSVGGTWHLILQNTDPTNARTMTLPSAAGVTFFSEDFGALRTTFTLLAGATVSIRFFAQTSTLVMMNGETVLISNLGAASNIDPTVDLLVTEQGGAQKKATLKEQLDAFSVFGVYPVIGGVGLRDAFAGNPGNVYLITGSDPAADFNVAFNPNAAGLLVISAGGANLTLRGTSVTPANANAAADLAKTNTTLTDFFFNAATVAASEAVSFVAIFDITADAVGGAKFAIPFSGTLSTLRWQYVAINAATGAVVSAGRQTSNADVISIPVGTVSLHVEIKGYALASAVGAFKMQFAQVAANGTSTALQGATFDVQFRDT